MGRGFGLPVLSFGGSRGMFFGLDFLASAFRILSWIFRGCTGGFFLGGSPAARTDLGGIVGVGEVMN